MDFGRSARDYATHRPGFPPELFDRAAEWGVGLPGQRVLDLGTGTGTLARGFAERGCSAVGVDVSQAMLDEAARLVPGVTWICARAEETDLPSAAFDVVSAGQCWHWFDRPRAASEVRRLLRPGGHALIAHWSYLPQSSSVAEATEALVLRHHPGWKWAGHDGRHPAFADDLVAAGLRHVTTLDVVIPIAFTHEAWRGRFRACNGVLALPREGMEAFDADLQRLLAERFPEPLVVDHRLYVILGEKLQGA